MAASTTFVQQASSSIRKTRPLQIKTCLEESRSRRSSRERSLDRDLRADRQPLQEAERERSSRNSPRSRALEKLVALTRDESTAGAGLPSKKRFMAPKASKLGSSYQIPNVVEEICHRIRGASSQPCRAGSRRRTGGGPEGGTSTRLQAMTNSSAAETRSPFLHKDP